MIHTNKQFFVITFAIFLTLIISTFSFAQMKSESNGTSELPRNFRHFPADQSEENPGNPQFIPSQNALKSDADLFLKPNNLQNSTAVSDVDPTFAPNISNYPGVVRATAVQADGKMLVGGFFKRINSEDHFNLIRFNANGSIDSGFTPKIGEIVQTIVVQPDGKILIGGGFNRVNGVARNHIARLNSDGSLDTTFDPGGGTDNVVYSLTLQPDGKIIVGGFFTRFNTEPRNNIVRLNADGSLDLSFNLYLESSGFVITTYLLPDGKILVGGFYSLANSTDLATLLRFNSNGSLDSTFNPGGSGASSTVREIKQQPDGKILISGSFSSYNGTNRGRIARLNADGTLDSTFNPLTGANATIYSITLLSSGKLYIGGAFTSYDGTSQFSIARLNADGTLDSSFATGSGFNGVIFETAPLASNQIFAGGNVTQYNGAAYDLAVRISSTGILDSTFYLSTMAPATIRASVQQPDGKIVVGGSFNIANGVNHNSLVRFNANGSNDTSFNAGTGTNGQIYVITMQTDGKILIGGSFTNYNGTVRNRIARINPNGTLDTAFAADANGSITNFAILPDGKILVTGGFSTFDGVSRVGVVKLNSDGTLDNSFVFNSPDAFIEGIGVQPDGKIIVGGIFRSVDSTARESLARLNPNGSLDSSFIPYTFSNTGIFSLALQPDGKVLIGGTFYIFAAQTQKNIARLNADGSLDNTFLIGSGTGENDDVEDIVIQQNGKILIGGAISSVNGVARNNIARLNSNGTLDLSFNANVDNFVWDINLDQSNPQRILIGGDFNSVNSVQRTGIARLILDLPVNRTPFDFDGDAKTDIGIFRPAPGEWWINRSSSGQTAALQFGNSSDKPVPADFTGDGKADVALWRPSSGEWFILRSEDNSYYSFPFGTSGDVPVPADYDGDGRADVGVFRPSTNTWYLLKSAGGTSIFNFGTSGDQPVIADYDGDGKADVAIYRPSLGQWWIQRSSNGSVYAFQFGISTDKPVQGDYTGDGRADTAIFRPSTGEWFILRSEDNSYYSVPFGISTDLPTPGDYDGDGKFDTAVFRPSENNWYVQRSSAGILILTFGTAGDKPLPNVFVP